MTINEAQSLANNTQVWVDNKYKVLVDSDEIVGSDSTYGYICVKNWAGFAGPVAVRVERISLEKK